MDDLNIGFNIVSHKGGKTIIEKFENGTVEESNRFTNNLRRI